MSSVTKIRPLQSGLFIAFKKIVPRTKTIRAIFFLCSITVISMNFTLKYQKSCASILASVDYKLGIAFL